MNDSPRTYRPSRPFLINLWQQAFYGATGVVVSWLIFWTLSELLLPSTAFQSLASWHSTPVEALDQLMALPERELIRYFTGPGMTIAVLFGGLIDYMTWKFVRYETSPDRLVMRWMSWSRSIAWDVVQTVQLRPHEKNSLRSMTLTVAETPPILVRGLEEMPELIETALSRTSKYAVWPPSPYRIDLTSRLTNFVIGFLLPIPIHVTWMAAYLGGLEVSSICSIWAWLLVAAAVAAWYWRPLSRRHMCAIEVELAIAALILLLSGLLTLLSWLESPMASPLTLFQF